jgi:GT2 family glycosyltransferase
MKNIDITIIIVHYNTPELTEKCILSVLQSDFGKYSTELIVVDNGTIPIQTNIFTITKSKQSTELHKYFYIQNKRNLGFAGGNNIAIRKALGRYILLLNSDTEVMQHTICEMTTFMDEHQDAGAGTCKVLLPDGSIDPACHRGFPTPWASLTYFSGLEEIFPHIRLFSQYHQLYKGTDTIHEIDSPSGAFMIVRTKTIQDIGLLDEEYFMYGEDLDWAYRMKIHHWKIYFNPNISILHKKKQSGRDHKDIQTRIVSKKYFYETMQLFYSKHYEKKYGPVLSWLVKIGIHVLSLVRS